MHGSNAGWNASQQRRSHLVHEPGWGAWLPSNCKGAHNPPRGAHAVPIDGIVDPPSYLAVWDVAFELSQPVLHERGEDVRSFRVRECRVKPIIGEPHGKARLTRVQGVLHEIPVSVVWGRPIEAELLYLGQGALKVGGAP